MHSCIVTLFFLFATLASARIFLSANDLPRHTTQSSQSPSGTCLKRYHDYDAVSGVTAYLPIFLTHPNDPNFELAILTQYTEFYPSTLEAWLLERKFTVRAFSGSTNNDLCGWKEYDSVVLNGRRHGQIGWRRNHVHLNAYASQPDNSTSVEGASGSYVSHTDPIKPSHDTVEVIRAILLTNTPHADIYSSRCSMLEWGLGITGLFFGCYILLSYVIYDEQREKLKVFKDSDDIELDQIKAHDLSGSAMQRMDTDDSDAPKCDIKITKPNALRSSPSSMGSGIATPPPMYALDGAGRSAVSVRDMV